MKLVNAEKGTENSAVRKNYSALSSCEKGRVKMDWIRNP